MGPELVQNVTDATAVALTLASFVLFALGWAHTLGTSFRLTIEPLLVSLRGQTDRARHELADLSVLVGVGLAGCGAVLEQPLAGCLLAGLLAWSRPMVRRATREENKLLALAGSISIDLVIGVYVPMVLAQVLLRNWFIAASLLALVVALSWPAGHGRAVPGRRWRLAPVAP